MAKSKDYLDYLDSEVGIAPAGSQEELDCAQTLAGVFTEHGLDPRVEEFSVPSLGSLQRGVVMVVMFLGVLLAGVGGAGLFLGLVLVVLSVVVVAFAYRGNDVLAKFGPRAHSQNVIAFHEAEGEGNEKNRPIVILAHYDTQRVDLLARPGLSAFKKLFAQALPYITIVVSVCALAQLLVFLPEAVRRTLWVVGVIAGLPALLYGISLIVSRFLPYAQGAVDNKSSLAAMFGVLEDVCAGGVPSASASDQSEGEAGEAAPEVASLDEGQDGQYVPMQGSVVQPTEPVAPTATAETTTVAPAEPVMRREVEPVLGVRHGERVLRDLGILPSDCDVIYIEPEVRMVPVAPEVPVTPASSPSASDGVPAAGSAAQAPRRPSVASSARIASPSNHDASSSEARAAGIPDGVPVIHRAEVHDADEAPVYHGSKAPTTERSSATETLAPVAAPASDGAPAPTETHALPQTVARSAETIVLPTANVTVPVIDSAVGASAPATTELPTSGAAADAEETSAAGHPAVPSPVGGATEVTAEYPARRAKPAPRQDADREGARQASAAYVPETDGDEDARGATPSEEDAEWGYDEDVQEESRPRRSLMSFVPKGLREQLAALEQRVVSAVSHVRGEDDDLPVDDEANPYGTNQADESATTDSDAFAAAPEQAGASEPAAGTADATAATSVDTTVPAPARAAMSSGVAGAPVSAAASVPATPAQAAKASETVSLEAVDGPATSVEAASQGVANEPETGEGDSPVAKVDEMGWPIHASADVAGASSASVASAASGHPTSQTTELPVMSAGEGFVNATTAAGRNDSDIRDAGVSQFDPDAVRERVAAGGAAVTKAFDKLKGLAGRFGGLENGERTDEGPVVETDHAGMDTMVEEDAESAAAALRPLRLRPEAIDDPDWGKNTFVPRQQKSGLDGSTYEWKTESGAAPAPSTPSESGATSAQTTGTFGVLTRNPMASGASAPGVSDTAAFPADASWTNDSTSTAPTAASQASVDSLAGEDWAASAPVGVIHRPSPESDGQLSPAAEQRRSASSAVEHDDSETDETASLGRVLATDEKRIQVEDPTATSSLAPVESASETTAHLARPAAAVQSPRPVVPRPSASVGKRSILFDLPDPLAPSQDGLAGSEASSGPAASAPSARGRRFRSLPSLEDAPGVADETAALSNQGSAAAHDQADSINKLASTAYPAGNQPVETSAGRLEGSGRPSRGSGSSARASVPGDIKVLSSDETKDEMPKVTKRRRFGLFGGGRKRQEQTESMSEWLGVDEDYNAKVSGEKIGSWDNFDDDDRRGHWKGGAARSAESRDLPHEDDSDLRDEVLAMDEDFLRSHDIWFVCTGASAFGHAGVRHFIEGHRKSLRGAFIVNLECVGAGQLSLLTREGQGNVRRSDRRLARLLTSVAKDLHIGLAQVDRPWADTEATPLMRKSMRAVTIMGMGDSELPALANTDADVRENVDETQVGDVNALVTEMIRRS